MALQWVGLVLQQTSFLQLFPPEVWCKAQAEGGVFQGHLDELHAQSVLGGARADRVVGAIGLSYSELLVGGGTSSH
jgi:hypothetical protein